MTEEMKKKLQTTQRRMMRIIIQTLRNTCKSHIELHDPNSAPVDDTECDIQDLNQHEESSHDADNNPCFDEIPEDNPEDELEPWVDYNMRGTHKADDLLAVNGIMS